MSTSKKSLASNIASIQNMIKGPLDVSQLLTPTQKKLLKEFNSKPFSGRSISPPELIARMLHRTSLYKDMSVKDRLRIFNKRK